jgi:hypothetical protein
MNTNPIQYLPNNYTIPFDVNLLKDGFYINNFIDLLSDKCAAFFVESNTPTNYKMIFNTYNYMEIYNNMTVNDKFRFHLEQKRRQFYADHNNILELIRMNPLFMVIYMYAEDGFRIGARPTGTGTFEFAGYASPAFYEKLMANKIRI